MITNVCTIKIGTVQNRSRYPTKIKGAGVDICLAQAGLPRIVKLNGCRLALHLRRDGIHYGNGRSTAVAVSVIIHCSKGNNIGTHISTAKSSLVCI